MSGHIGRPDVVLGVDAEPVRPVEQTVAKARMKLPSGSNSISGIGPR
jgi:hypothetical protein